MRTDPNSEQATGRARPLRRLLQRLRPIRWQAAGAYGAMLVASGIALVVPLALRDIVDVAIGARPDALAFLPGGLTDRQRLLAGAGLIVVLALVRAVVSFWQRYGTAWVGRTIATDLRRDLMAHLLDREQAFHDRASVGQLMTRITDDTEQVRAFAATGAADLANILALLVGTSALLWSIDPSLAPIALGAVPIVAALAVIGARMLLPRFLELQQARGGLSARLQEALAHVRIVQAFRAERRTSERYDADNEIVYGKRLDLTKIFTTVFPGMSAVLGLATALVLLVGGRRVAAGATTVGSIVAFMTYIVLLGEPVRRLGFLLNLAARASASAARVFELLDQPAVLPPGDGGAPHGGWRGRVRWDGVTFGFGDVAVLTDVDLTVEAGEHVAIVGRSGAGKTALVSLLTRLYDPDAGRVLIDDVDVATLRRPAVAAAVATVEQEAFLFSASIADNIAFARPDAPRGDVEAAGRLAGVDAFARELPDGYDTVVGERGVTLSGGQRQRVALARALLLDAPVLVLDDAVSAVDARTERAIRAALADGARRRTIISVAQRLSTVRAADRIVVLDRGRIVEQGTHGDLVAAGGAYARLFGEALGLTVPDGFDRDGGAGPLDGVRGSGLLDRDGGAGPLDGDGRSGPFDGDGRSGPLDGDGGASPGTIDDPDDDLDPDLEVAR